MSMMFNADEIFEIAEQIEHNGAAFYRRAAEGALDARDKRKLLDLAEMELSHERTFAAMRAELSGREREPTVFDPYDEAALYLRAIADGHVFDINADPAADLAEKPIAEILKIAIGMEKDSIIFYLGLREIVPADRGKDKVEKIIAEEMSHITLLSDELAALSR